MNNNILDTIDDVKGEIYKISNKIDNKIYIGQTRTHYMNHGKYRPYGYIGRFNSHISEAILNSKKKQCTYLNNAIRKYGKENFIVELLETCQISQLDELEKNYISTFNSIYPNGYNLTYGGKTTSIAKIENNKINNNTQKDNKKSEDTKKLISLRLKDLHNNNIEIKEKWSNNAIEQHNKNRMIKYKNISVDISNIDQYIKPVFNKNTKLISHYKVIINNIKTKFTGSCIETTKTRAIEFIKNIHTQHNQIDGNSSQEL